MNAISLVDVKPHLRVTLFLTGSFVVAWSWDLMSYGISHIWQDENPMGEDQIGFADNGGPKYLLVLLLQYLVVCGLTAWLSYQVQHTYYQKPWCAAAIKAIEFLPAPFFSGKLMSYLSQFTQLSDLHQVLLNFLATAFAAFLAHASEDPRVARLEPKLPPQLRRFRPILADTLGFGLGVAWNVFLMKLLAPEEMDGAHIVGLFGYLMVVLLIAFRIAAEVGSDAEEDPQQPSTTALMQRVWSMLSFAFNVVCAFTMVAFVHALLLDGWVGDGLCLVILIALAAILSAGVASVSPQERPSRQQQQQQQQQMEEGEDPECGFGTNHVMDSLVFVPCVWCCCPWIPLVWILSGVTPNIHVKEKWQDLIAFVLGLASSIQASGMLTKATDQIATELGICDSKHCSHPWLFILLQTVLAIMTTAALLPPLGLVSDEVVLHEDEEQSQTQPGASSSTQRGERQPLLGKIKKMMPKYSRTKSKSSSQSTTATRK